MAIIVNKVAGCFGISFPAAINALVRDFLNAFSVNMAPAFWTQHQDDSGDPEQKHDEFYADTQSGAEDSLVVERVGPAVRGE